MLWKARRRNIHDSIVQSHYAIYSDPLLFTNANDVCSPLWDWSGWANEAGAYKMFVPYFRKTTHSRPHPLRYLRKSISIMHTSSAPSLLCIWLLFFRENPLEADTLFLIKLLFLSQFLFGFCTTRQWTSFVSNFSFQWLEEIFFWFFMLKFQKWASRHNLVPVWEKKIVL